MAQSKKTAFITGASFGIGEAFANVFAEAGYDLVLVARNQERLNAIRTELISKYNHQVLTIAADITNREAIEGIADILKEKAIAVDVLVNNAGCGVYGEFKNTNLDDELNMLQLNMVALTSLTKLVLPGMTERKNGKILNIASTTAFLPGPSMACYFGTKAYVLSFSEAIYQELKGLGVTVTVLCPGPTQTGFQSRAGVDHLGLFGGKNVMSADQVARIGYDALMKKKRVVICGLHNKIMIRLLRLLPKSWVLSVIHYFQRLRKTGQ